MSANIVTLTGNNNEIIYPLTTVDAVVDNNGNKVNLLEVSWDRVINTPEIVEYEKTETMIGDLDAAWFSNVILKTPQTLNDDEKKQARNNIGAASKTPIINHGITNTTTTIEPNKFYIWDAVGSLNITLATPSETEFVNIYAFQFSCGGSPTNLVINGVKWIGEEPSLETDKTYQVTILNGLAAIGGA